MAVVVWTTTTAPPRWRASSEDDSEEKTARDGRRKTGARAARGNDGTEKRVGSARWHPSVATRWWSTRPASKPAPAAEQQKRLAGAASEAASANNAMMVRYRSIGCAISSKSR
ncbi:hypothetical protein Scep_004797 [Stephania cephalantha]|uniref:Uncharacterized protein n=1 Tax=Stephania cephalantha TaxID=152367 RepID=A0AAP0KUI0_9MAGN